jgi:DNA-binding transcriptional regulator YhcF (GntR family)
LGHPAFRNDAEAMAFAWLVVKAAWKQVRVRYKDRAIVLERGQIAISVRDFAQAMDRDKAWIERLLKRLRAEAMVETLHETGVNVITICNYEVYQAQKDTRKTSGETLAETEARQGRDTEQEREEGNIPPIAPRKRGAGKHLLPDDWELPPIAELTPKAKECAEQWPEGAYEREGEAFVCFWRSRRRMMSDWRLTWANRVIDQHGKVIREAQQQSRSRPAEPPKFSSIYLEEQRRKAAAGAH